MSKYHDTATMWSYNKFTGIWCVFMRRGRYDIAFGYNQERVNGRVDDDDHHVDGWRFRFPDGNKD